MVKNYHFKKGSRAFRPMCRTKQQIASLKLFKFDVAAQNPPLMCIKAGMTTAFDRGKQFVAATILVPLPYQISNKLTRYKWVSGVDDYLHDGFRFVGNDDLSNLKTIKEYCKIDIKYHPSVIVASKRNKCIIRSWLASGGSDAKDYQYEKVLSRYMSAKTIRVIAVTKGKGFTGSIKRYGLCLKKRKHSRAGKTRHKGGGSRTPKRVNWTIPMPGQMGYTRRTFVGNLVINSHNPQIMNALANHCLKGYGKLAGDFLLIKGSIPGPIGRCIMIQYE